MLFAGAVSCGGSSSPAPPGEPVDGGIEATAADPGPAPEEVAPVDVAPEAAGPDIEDAPVEVAEDAEENTAEATEDVEDVAETDSEDVEEEVDVPPPPPPYWDLPPGYDQLHFETIPVDVEGKTDDLAVVLPPDTASVTIMTSGPPSDVWMRVGKLVTSQGYAIVKGQGDVSCMTCVNRVFADHDLSTAMAPNSPEVPYKGSGKYLLQLWQFTVKVVNDKLAIKAYLGTPVTSRILFKHWVGEPQAGTLDLNLWFTGVDELTAATAPTNAWIVQMLADVDAIYAQAGIQLGTVTYQDAPEGTPQIVNTTIAADSDLSKLFLTTSEAPTGINVFFVSSILREELTGTGGIVLGIAGGIPGPPFVVKGSPHSGVAIALTDIANMDVAALGSVLAHEVGHYLGLFHSTEKDGDPEKPETTTHDPIEDTPEFDKTNLMWWASEGGKTITPGQKFVMLRHPDVWLQDPPQNP